MLDAFHPAKDDNLFQPLNSENQPDILSTSHPCQNPLNPGFGEQIEAFDNPVADFTEDPLWESVLDPGETYVDRTLVDLLTGEALQNFAADPDFDDKISLAFGDNWNREVVKDLQQNWLSGDFSDIPQVQILSADVLPAANGAYSSQTNTIYLSRDFLTENAANPTAVADVLLEEYGHAIDAKINAVDAAGDEGELFAKTVRNEALSDGELLALKVEDDSGMITLDGEEISIEQAKFKPKAGGDRVVDIIRQERGSFIDNHRDAEIHLSKGDWNFNKQSTLPEMRAMNGDVVNMVTGDFNGDGLTDFIRQEKGYFIDGHRDAEVYLAAGNGTFRNPIQMRDMSLMNGDFVNLVAGDFNGDGKTDIIRQEKGRWVNGRRDAEIYLSNGNGTFGNPILMNNAWWMNGDNVNLIVGDFTGGGADDIIRQEKGNWVDGVNDVEFLTFSRGNFGKVKNVPDMGMMNGNFVNLIAGDFNGDRIIDLVRQEKGSWVDGRRDAEIYISNGRWNFRSVTLMNNSWWMNGDYVNLIAGDFTGGGADDIIRQEKGRWVDGSNDAEFLTYSGGNFNKVKNVPDMSAMNGNSVTLVPGLFGSSSEPVTNPTPNPNPTLTPIAGSLFNNPDSFFGWAKGRIGIERLDTSDYRGQCVSLVARYIQEVFLPSNQRTIRKSFNNGELTASTVASSFSQYFEPLTTSGLPERGAIISFDGPGSNYVGHVGIVLEARYNNGQREVKILESNADGKAQQSTVTESHWINIKDYPGSIVAGTTGWTNPR